MIGGYTTYDLIVDDAGPADVVLPTEVERMFVIPATVDLSSADIELMANEKRSFLLHDALRQPAMDQFSFDYILIDCPPSLNLLTVNAMVASSLGIDPSTERVFRFGGIVTANADHPRGSPKC